MSDTLTVSVLDTLHDVTMDTIFDAAERFDPLVRDLRTITTEHGSCSPEGMALCLRHSWGEHLSPREEVILRFLYSLPVSIRYGHEIAAGLEGR